VSVHRRCANHNCKERKKGSFSKPSYHDVLLALSGLRLATRRKCKRRTGIGCITYSAETYEFSQSMNFLGK
jgi:hypothetical protein